MEMQKRNRRDISMGDRRFPQAPRRLWIFLILGIIIIIAGIVVSGLYFNIQAITSSQSHTEILPTYIISLVVVLCGALVILLFWKRPIVLVFLSVVCCIGTGGLCGVIAILTFTHILQPITSLHSCYHNDGTCICSSPYKKDSLHLDYSETATTQYTFDKTDSCTSVTTFLPTLLYSLCGLYFLVLFLCLLSAIFAFLVLRVEKSKFSAYQEETYEEIFTISGSSSTLTDCDNDLHVMEKDTTGIVAPSQIISSHVTGGSCRGTTGSCRSVPTTKSGILKPFDRQGNQNFVNSSRLSRSCDSIDVIYAQTKGNSPSVDDANNGWGIPQKGTGKLKEHRRKDRRAVTLHNLDTKQLMLILSLQMRYLEETKLLKSQGNLNVTSNQDNIPLARRAMTPQPYHQKRLHSNTLPKLVKSNTPEPEGKELNSGKFYHSDIDPVYGVPISSSKHKQREVRDIEAFQSLVKASKNTGQNVVQTSQNMECFDVLQNQMSKSKKKEIMNSNSMPSKRFVDPEEVNGMNLHEQFEFALKSKSRASVQHYFLPPEPVHRSKSALPAEPIRREITTPPEPQHRQSIENSKLPPQPIRRQTDQTPRNLPQEPLHRGGSAFQAVGRPSKKMPQRGDSSHLGPVYGRNAQSHDSVLTNPGEFYYQQAIRDNFRLFANPFMLQTNSPTRSVNTSELTFQSEPPPPYAPPPTYREFLSISDGSVLSDSQDENTDREDFNDTNSQIVTHPQGQNCVLNQHLQDSDENQDRQNVLDDDQSLLSASDDDVFVSGNLSEVQASLPVYSQVVKRSKMQNLNNFTREDVYLQNAPTYSNKMSQILPSTPLGQSFKDNNEAAYFSQHDSTSLSTHIGNPEYSGQNLHSLSKLQTHQPQHPLPLPSCPVHHYEEIDDLDVNYGYHDDDSSFGVSSQSSLIPEQAVSCDQGNRSQHLNEKHLHQSNGKVLHSTKSKWNQFNGKDLHHLNGKHPAYLDGQMVDDPNVLETMI